MSKEGCHPSTTHLGGSLGPTWEQPNAHLQGTTEGRFHTMPNPLLCSEALGCRCPHKAGPGWQFTLSGSELSPPSRHWSSAPPWKGHPQLWVMRAWPSESTLFLGESEAGPAISCDTGEGAITQQMAREGRTRTHIHAACILSSSLHSASM